MKLVKLNKDITLDGQVFPKGLTVEVVPNDNPAVAEKLEGIDYADMLVTAVKLPGREEISIGPKTAFSPA